VLDADRVLVFTRMSARGKTSGVELEWIRDEGAKLFHLRSERVTRLAFYWDPSTRSPTSASPRRMTRRESLGELGPRAVD
jgi:hypothetical protein